MLGHKLWQVLSADIDTFVTIRGDFDAYRRYDLFDRARTFPGIDAGDLDAITRLIAVVKPDHVVNCIGIIKQVSAAQDPLTSIGINSLFPHRLANVCVAAGARLIHISTDCVFSGRKGGYREDDISDAEDLYGRSKFLGEVSGPGSLTLRTSIIGRELRSTTGLVEWFLANRGGSVAGYTNAIFSGLTTLELSRLIRDIITRHRELTGLYQVSVDPIRKLDLLRLLNEAYGTKTEIRPDEDVHVDRSLDSSRFRTATGYRPPKWEALVSAMKDDPTPYDRWRTPV
jgi:dTDP-4-dehydrorhamnose reductase